MKNVLFWCGVQGKPSVQEKYRYGDYKWMEYSKTTWEYWCKKNNVIFLHYDNTSLEDQMKYKINWQRWIDIVPFVQKKVGDFDQVLAVDASFMVKWDAPNFFDQSENKWCGLIGNENLKWVRESVEGYKQLFNNFEFDYSQHLLAGFTLFNKSHIPFFENLTKFYFDNHEQILMLEDKLVKRGRDQPVLNYLIQMNKIDVKTFPLSYGANHMWRRNMLGKNPCSEDSTPMFIKNLHTWCFSGFPDRGDSRTELMKQTWEIVKGKYE